MSELNLDAEMAALQSREQDGAINPENIGDGDRSTKNALRETQRQAEGQQQQTEPKQGEERAPLTPEQYAERDRQKTAALREERQRARQAQRVAEDHAREVAAARAEQQRMARNMEAMLARAYAQQQQPAQQQERPAQIDLNQVEQKPLDTLRALAEKVQSYEQQQLQAQQQAMAEQQRRQQEYYAQVQQAEQISRLASDLQESEKDFALDYPDYDDAAKHFVETRIDYFTRMFPGHPKAQIHQAVQHELLQSAQTAFLNGHDPAKLIYEAASALGYKRGAQQQPQQQQSLTQQQKLQADPLALVREGQSAATSLSAGGSPGQAGSMGIEDLLKLDGAAFDAASAKFLKEMTRR